MKYIIIIKILILILSHNLFAQGSVPVISSITPDRGPIGTILVIEGSGFSESINENSVTIGDKDVIVKYATATKLTCVIPEDATTGEVIVFVGGLSTLPPHPIFEVLPNQILPVPNVNNLEIIDLVCGDLDNDGYDDIIPLYKEKPKDTTKPVVRKDREFKGHITLLKKNNAEGFIYGSPTIYSMPELEYDSNFTKLLHFDMNQDGRPDYFAAYGKTVSEGRSALKITMNSTSNPGNLLNYYLLLLDPNKKLSAAQIGELSGDDTIDVVIAYEPKDG